MGPWRSRSTVRFVLLSDKMRSCRAVCRGRVAYTKIAVDDDIESFRSSWHNFPVSGPIHLLSLCSILASALYICLGAYILRSNPRARLNRVFFLACLSFLFWSFSYTFLPGAPDKEQAWFWFKMSAPGWTLSPALLLHFLILMSRNEAWLERRWVYPVIYLPGVYFLIQALFGRMGVSDFVWTEFGWSDLYEPLTPSYAAYLLYFSTYILFGLWLVMQWGRSSGLIAERRQAQLIVYTGAPVLLAVSLSGIFLPWMEIRNPPEVAHLIAPLWALAIWYSVVTYKLMVITPAGVAPEILRTMADAVILLNRNQKIAEVNDAAERLLTASRRELRGRTIRHLFELEDATEAEIVQALLTGQSSDNLELRYRSKGGDLVPVRVSASEVKDRHGQDVGVVLIVRDISEQKKAEAELHHLATHDPLTGLPNRSILRDRLQRAMTRALRVKRPFALLMFDLDDFQQVNDSFGHRAGDIVLQKTASRLEQCVRGLDTVCRLGSDEFMILVQDLIESPDSEIVAKRILASFREPIAVGNQVVNVTGSLGVSIYPSDGLSPDTLTKKADLALRSSKQQEKGGYQFYAPRMAALNRERAQIEQGLRNGLERKEFYLAYQPMVNHDSGRIAGVEALLRWHSPELGLVGPNKFIPVAERSGLIIPIGQSVLEIACQTSREWQTEGLPAVPMSVNISAKQLQQADFVTMVEDVLQNTNLEPSLLELELTESVAMDDVDHSLRVFSQLRDLGVRIVIDDFGTGYSSLVRLKQLPVQAIKVDRSFIKNIADDPKDRSLVMAIVAMARNLGMEVIAEGVETAEQLTAFRSSVGQLKTQIRFDRLQGYLFSRPVPKHEIPELFSRERVFPESGPQLSFPPLSA